MSGLFEALFSADPEVRSRALADLHLADPDEVDAVFRGLRLVESDGFRWDERFRKTSFDRRGLRRYLNVVLGHAPAACKVAMRAAARFERVILGGSEAQPAPLHPSFDFSRFGGARVVHLERATVEDLGILDRLPPLEVLELTHVTVLQPGVLRLLAVRDLRLYGLGEAVTAIRAVGLTMLSAVGSPVPLAGLDGLDQLDTLSLCPHPLVDFADLPVLDALERVTVLDAPHLASCAGLDRQPALEHVDIASAPQLASLEGLPPRLSTLGLRQVPGLRSLDGLPRIAGDSLIVEGATSLVDVSRIPEIMPDIERIRLEGVARRIDLSPLVPLGALRLLDLRDSRGVTSVEAFLGHDSLRALLLGGTRVARTSVPPRDRWRCTWARHPNVDELVHRPPPARETWDRLAGGGRIVLAKIRKLLRSADLDVIEQGLQLLATLGDPHLYDALLEGTDYRQVRPTTRINRRPWRLGSRRFVGSTRSYVLHRLLSDAPDEACFAAALRESVHTLDFVESRYPPRPHPFELSSLAALPGLRSLAFARFGPLTFDELRGATIPELTQLELHHQPAPVPVAWLAAQAGLVSALLVGEHAGSRDLSWVPGLPRLERLAINQQSQLDLAPLREAPALKELSIWSCSGITDLDGVPDGVESVRVSWCWQLTDLSRLLELESLREFRRHGCAIPEEQLAALADRGVAIVT